MKHLNFNSVVSKIGAVCIAFFIILIIIYGIKFASGEASSITDIFDSIPSSKTYFDTVVSIEIYESDSKCSNSILTKNCYEICEKYENLYSTSSKDGDVYKLNHSNGEKVDVDSDTIIIVNRALFYSKYSDGAFDITIEPLSSLWNFGKNKKTVPDEEEIKEAVKKVDYNNIIVEYDYDNNGTIQFKAIDTSIDLGAIAKGYVADKVKEYLVSEGVTSAIINFGGNILTIGNKPDGNDFTIGIQKPFGKTNETIATISINDKAVVTSGVYERYFYKDDVLYHHILNPRDGYPFNNGLYSVTIITDASCDADALSTTCFAMGLDDAKELLKIFPSTEAVFIMDDGTIETTSGIEYVDGKIIYLSE